MRRVLRHPQWVCALAGVLICSSLSAAPGGPDDGGPPQMQTTDIAGRIESLNLNTQRGELDGLILNVNGTRVQVNLPESVVDVIAKAIAVGDVVQATVTAEGGPGRGGPGGRGGRGPEPDGRGPPPGLAEQPADHPVYRAISFRDAHGKFYVAQDRGPGGEEAMYGGRVKALNYDHRGAINGLQLLNGDLIKLPPNSAAGTVRPGDEVSVTGNMRTMAGGEHLIDAKTLNGADLRPPPGGRGGRGPDADGRGPDPAGRGRGPDGAGRGGRDGRGPGVDADDDPPEPNEGPPPPPSEGPPEPEEGPPPPPMEEPFRPQYTPAMPEPPEDFGPPPPLPGPPEEDDDAF
jgi:hypothetical protein